MDVAGRDVLDGAHSQTKQDTTQMTRATLPKQMREVMVLVESIRLAQMSKTMDAEKPAMLPGVDPMVTNGFSFVWIQGGFHLRLTHVARDESGRVEGKRMHGRTAQSLALVVPGSLPITGWGERLRKVARLPLRRRRALSVERVPGRR